MATRTTTATRATFRVKYPEFDKATDALVDVWLADAIRSCDQDVWGDRCDDGVYVLCAHLLALSPFGQQARLSSGGTSTYKGRYDQMVLEVAVGARVV